MPSKGHVAGKRVRGSHTTHIDEATKIIKMLQRHGYDYQVGHINSNPKNASRGITVKINPDGVKGVEIRVSGKVSTQDLTIYCSKSKEVAEQLFQEIKSIKKSPYAHVLMGKRAS